MQQISHEHSLYTGPYASPGYTTETHSPLEKQTHKHTNRCEAGYYWERSRREQMGRIPQWDLGQRGSLREDLLEDMISKISEA